MVLQNAPAHLRQRWQEVKLGLEKEMQQHQQVVAWSVIGAPCLGAPAGADLLTESDASATYWSSSSSNNNSTNNSSNRGPVTDSNRPDNGPGWPRREAEQSNDSHSFQYSVKAEPIETDDDVIEECIERPTSAVSPPQTLSPPPPSPSPVILSASAPGGGHDPPPSEQNDGPPPPKNKKHSASQTNLPVPVSPSTVASAELELRLNGLRRAQQRAEELHHEQLRESRARVEAAEAERDHRLQLMRHAEEIHQQALEAQRQALEHNRQLHEIAIRQAHSKPCE